MINMNYLSFQRFIQTSEEGCSSFGQFLFVLDQVSQYIANYFFERSSIFLMNSTPEDTCYLYKN